MHIKRATHTHYNYVPYNKKNLKLKTRVNCLTPMIPNLKFHVPGLYQYLNNKMCTVF